MAKVTPSVLLSGLPCASFNVPANLIRRGTANVGTTSLGACAVRLGACGSAATGRCCACAPAMHRKDTKHNRDHLAVRFMGHSSLPTRKESKFSLGQSRGSVLT